MKWLSSSWFCILSRYVSFVLSLIDGPVGARCTQREELPQDRGSIRANLSNRPTTLPRNHKPNTADTLQRYSDLAGNKGALGTNAVPARFLRTSGPVDTMTPR
jgi:hypothetical protein